MHSRGGRRLHASQTTIFAWASIKIPSPFWKEVQLAIMLDQWWFTCWLLYALTYSCFWPLCTSLTGMSNLKVTGNKIATLIWTWISWTQNALTKVAVKEKSCCVRWVKFSAVCSGSNCSLLMCIALKPHMYRVSWNTNHIKTIHSSFHSATSLNAPLHKSVWQWQIWRLK